jgi:hypothetical protein
VGAFTCAHAWSSLGPASSKAPFAPTTCLAYSSTRRAISTAARPLRSAQLAANACRRTARVGYASTRQEFYLKIFSKYFCSLPSSYAAASVGGSGGPPLCAPVTPRRFDRPGRSAWALICESHIPRMLMTVRAVGAGVTRWQRSTSPHRSASARLRHSTPGRDHGVRPSGPDRAGR